jgi:polysaccharide export outer membrane protein
MMGKFGTLIAIASLTACSTLPSSGPTAGDIVRFQKGARNQIGYAIVALTPEVVAAAGQRVDTNLLALESLAGYPPPQSADQIRPGDQLAISIYEVGISLFGGAASVGNMQNSATTTVGNVTAGGPRMTVQVDERGQIYLPYVGLIQVAGRVPLDVQQEIQSRLRPMSQSPEVVVAIVESVENVVYLSGMISKPGRYRLSAARERLADLIALAGGSGLDPADAEVRLVREGRVASAKLIDIRAEAVGNVVLRPGDRIEVVRNPRSYTVFGASDRVSQIPFGNSNVTLTEAIARAGGPADNRANPAAVFVFRYETDEKPVIYRLNLKDPQSYFLSQRFQVRDKDVLYFANSPSNPPAKLINLINMLFSPLVTARVLTN